MTGWRAKGARGRLHPTNAAVADERQDRAELRDLGASSGLSVIAFAKHSHFGKERPWRGTSSLAPSEWYSRFLTGCSGSRATATPSTCASSPRSAPGAVCTSSMFAWPTSSVLGAISRRADEPDRRASASIGVPHTSCRRSSRERRDRYSPDHDCAWSRSLRRKREPALGRHPLREQAPGPAEPPQAATPIPKATRTASSAADRKRRWSHVDVRHTD